MTSQTLGTNQSIIITLPSYTSLLLALLMGQYCFACWRLLSSSVTLPAAGRVGGRHCTAGQYGYVPLWRQVVLQERVLTAVFLVNLG